MARILIVDDENDIIELVALCLGLDGHETGAAVSKGSLMQKLETFKPDLIILDVMLGQEDGRLICKELKSSKFSAIPIMLYSAAPEVLHNFIEYNANQALNKPFDIDVLRSKVNQLVVK